MIFGNCISSVNTVEIHFKCEQGSLTNMVMDAQVWTLHIHKFVCDHCGNWKLYFKCEHCSIAFQVSTRFFDKYSNGWTVESYFKSEHCWNTSKIWNCGNKLPVWVLTNIAMAVQVSTLSFHNLMSSPWRVFFKCEDC